MRALARSQLQVLFFLSLAPTLVHLSVETSTSRAVPSAGVHQRARARGTPRLSRVPADGAGHVAAAQPRRRPKQGPDSYADSHVASVQSSSVQLKKYVSNEKMLRSMGHTSVGDVGLVLSTSTASKNDASRLLEAVVANVTKGGPADKGGVKKGDVVLSIDGVHVTPSCFASLESLLEGPSGSSVRVTVQRRGQKEAKTFDLMRHSFVTTQHPDTPSAQLPHDLDAPGPCFACLPNPAPKMLGNVSISFLWPAYLGWMRKQRARDRHTVNSEVEIFNNKLYT